MGLIVDSSEAISAERQGLTAHQMVERIARFHLDQEVAFSVVSVLELVHGVVRANSPQRCAQRQRFLDDLLTGMPIHPVTVPIALRAGRLEGEMQAIGKRINLADLLIGATAIELGYSVLTANRRHFDQIPGLTVVGP
jgi:tRNA(fMet)-specific endonuclease VapC